MVSQVTTSIKPGSIHSPWISIENTVATSKFKRLLIGVMSTVIFMYLDRYRGNDKILITTISPSTVQCYCSARPKALPGVRNWSSLILIDFRLTQRYIVLMIASLVYLEIGAGRSS